MKNIVYMVAMFGVLAASTAIANDGKMMNKTQRMDKNRDGVVSQSESDEYKQMHMKYADANRDGKVSEDEWTTYQVSRHDQYADAYVRQDKNRNRAEYKDLPSRVMLESNYDKYNRYAPAAGGDRTNSNSTY